MFSGFSLKMSNDELSEKCINKPGKMGKDQSGWDSKGRKCHGRGSPSREGFLYFSGNNSHSGNVSSSFSGNLIN